MLSIWDRMLDDMQLAGLAEQNPIRLPFYRSTLCRPHSQTP